MHHTHAIVPEVVVSGDGSSYGRGSNCSSRYSSNSGVIVILCIPTRMLESIN